MSEVSTLSINDSHLKKKLRDTSRLLKRSNISAEVRQIQERKLAHLEHLIHKKETEEKEKELAQRYRKVRFFEQKKAVRKLVQAAKAFIKKPERDNAEAFFKCKKNHMYVVSFPANVKYISLFPSSELVEASVIEKRDNIMKALCAESGLNGELPIDHLLNMAKEEIKLQNKKSPNGAKSNFTTVEDDSGTDEESDESDEADENHEENKSDSVDSNGDNEEDLNESSNENLESEAESDSDDGYGDDDDDDEDDDSEGEEFVSDEEDDNSDSSEELDDDDSESEISENSEVDEKPSKKSKK